MRLSDAYNKCVGNLTRTGSDNGQAIIWNNAGILLISLLGANFKEILIEIHTFSLQKVHFKMLYGKWRPFCLCLNVWKLQKQGQHGSCCWLSSSKPGQDRHARGLECYEMVLVTSRFISPIVDEEIVVQKYAIGWKNNIAILVHINTWPYFITAVTHIIYNIFSPIAGLMQDYSISILHC